MIHSVTELGKPTFYILSSNNLKIDEVVRMVTGHKSKVSVNIIRGNQSRTVEGFFDEVSSVLDFPDYFGRNWNAFNDCITDVRWLGQNKDAYILLIEDANSLLELADIEDFDIMLEMLDEANDEWKLPTRFDLIPSIDYPKALHVIFQIEPDEQSSFVSKLEKAARAFAILEI